MFRSARVKLTAAYTIGIAVIMAAFSVVLYIALGQALAGNLEAPGGASAQLEQAILGSELARARIALLAINLAGWSVSALVSWIVAGRTLRPIEQSLERQRRFAAHASHELRTPLTVIKGEIEVTLARQRSPEAYREILKRVDGEVDHLEATVRSLLDLARSGASQVRVRTAPRAIGETLEEIAAPFRTRSREKEVRIVVEAPGDLRATLDWNRIDLVIRNLLDNALRHTSESGLIRLRARRYGSHLELTVFNSGAAVAPDDLPHLFVPFYRGRGSDPESGTGLGLALCDWVTQAEGGSIAVHNVPDGVRFTVRLPLR